MSDLEIIDTFPVFLGFWAEAREKAIEDQIELWAGEDMSYWPELLDAQIQDYSEQNLDWKQIARERVFPYLQERLPAMQEARANLLRLSPIIFSKAEHTLNINTSTCFVIYVGIGCGAGWVTTYQGVLHPFWVWNTSPSAAGAIGRQSWAWSPTKSVTWLIST